MGEPRNDGAVRSLLRPVQRLWLTVALALAAVLLANTLYLVANRLAAAVPAVTIQGLAQGTERISALFQIMVLSHTGLGFVVVGLLAVFAVWHLPSVWRRHRRRTITTGVVFVLAGAILAATGPFIMYAAATREHTWVWWLHVVAGAVVPVAYVLHRSVSYVPPRRQSVGRFATVLTATFVAAIVGHVLAPQSHIETDEARVARSKGTDTGPGSRARDITDYTDAPFVAASFVPPASPFFPSAATTTTGDYLPSRIITRRHLPAPEVLAPDLDETGFVVSETIGADDCQRCHPDTTEQWSASAHRFASFNNPFYEATINDMRKNAVSLTRGVSEHLTTFPQWADRVGQIKSKWCSGCHDPALMLAGQMTETIDRRSVQAQAGLTCLACHAIDRIHNNTGNGNYNIADEQEDPYLYGEAGAGTLAALLHDTAIKAKPDVHKRQMLKPFFRGSEFCATCHKVSLQEPVNDYRWFRGQNEYDNWHDSGVALNAARTFYLPPNYRVCQDCHMPPEPAPLGDVAAKGGMVRSHRFLAVNTALPFVRGDVETIERVERFLRDAKLRIDVFALVRGESDHAQPVYALDVAKPTLTSGDDVTFEVVVRNLGVGHTFPGGTNDSNESWIEFTVLDGDGNVVAQSGAVGENGYVDPSAHFFRALLVDRHGEPIHRRNAQDIYAPVYNNVIGPGTAQVAHYRVRVPAAAGPLTVRARLMWRKFDRAYTEFAYANNPDGFKRFDACPDLPITEIARSEIALAVSAEDTGAVHVIPDPSSPWWMANWTRLNDYGIGLLLQGDTKGAGAAFARLAEYQPDRVDGPRNRARVALRDGDLHTAYESLLRCEELESNDPRTAWFWGLLLQEDGRYVEAASAYRRVLQRFPDDRATWRNLGRTYYLDGKHEQSIEAMQRVLAIDPEDRVAHYHQMLAARTLGRDALAAVAEASYLQFKIDESAAQVTQAYRIGHVDDNRESQPIHVHDLVEEQRGAAEVAQGPSSR